MKFRLIWPAVLTAAAGILLFLLLALSVSSGEPTSFDRWTADALRSLDGPGIASAMKFLTHSASVPAASAAGLLLCFAQWIKMRQPWETIAVALTLAVPTIAVLLLKRVFSRPRPSEYPWLLDAQGFSFPSGHTMAAVIIAGIALWMVWKVGRTGWNAALTILLFFYSLSVGVSRVFLGVHYASDVAASIALGAAFLSISYIFTNRRNLWKHWKRS